MISTDSLPDSLRQYLRRQVERGIYQSEAEVIEAALRGQIDRERQIDELLEESLHCGPPFELKKEMLDDLVKRAVARQRTRPTSL